MDERLIVPPYLRNSRLLTTHDEEYHRLSYLMRLSLHSATARVVSIHAIHPPSQDVRFEAAFADTAVVDAWVYGADLGEDNAIPTMIHHGGRFRLMDDRNGVIFRTGSIPIDAILEGAPGEARREGRHRLEFLHCRVAVGRSFAMDPSQVGTMGIPNGYDSIMIYAGAEGPKPYFREYVVAEERRIYAHAVVTVDYATELDAMHEVAVCEECRARRAAVYCIQDDAKLCEACDATHHEANSITARHVRVRVEEMQKTLGRSMCPEHRTMQAMYYDPVSALPLCVQCKVAGSHSYGENATHPIITMQDAFEQSVATYERQRRLVDERRGTIKQQLGSIESRMLAINANYEQCQDDVYAIVRQLLKSLHNETQSKLSALLSDEAELKRQLEYYDWAEEFLEGQARQLPPASYMPVQRRHVSLVTDAPSEIVDGASEVQADLQIRGRLEVVVGAPRPTIVDIPSSRASSRMDASAKTPKKQVAMEASGSRRWRQYNPYE